MNSMKSDEIRFEGTANKIIKDILFYTKYNLKLKERTLARLLRNANALQHICTTQSCNKIMALMPYVDGTLTTSVGRRCVVYNVIEIAIYRYDMRVITVNK